VRFPFDLYALSLFSGLATCLAIMHPVRLMCLRAGLVDHPGHRKIHAAPVPLAGGPALLLTLFIVIAGGALITILIASGDGDSSAIIERLTYAWGVRYHQLLMILAGALMVTLMGLFDDRSAMKAAPKFAVQIAAALMVSLSGIRITVFIDSVIVHHMLTVFWVLLLVNAFNFMDNMNGASAGLALISTVACAIAGHQSGQYLVPAFGFLVSGAILGFLPHNFPAGRVFLGDSGSHLLGYLVAVTTILATYYAGSLSDCRMAVLSPLLFVMVPVLDLGQVTLYRILKRRPVWIGDTNHLTHRLSRTALGKSGAVLTLWAIAAIAAGLPWLIFRLCD
jgi:UDP-GlcNAc:undecaprenyl-phosphate GlcNAc-1-phosphate transferase